MAAGVALLRTDWIPWRIVSRTELQAHDAAITAGARAARVQQPHGKPAAGVATIPLPTPRHAGEWMRDPNYQRAREDHRRRRARKGKKQREFTHRVDTPPLAPVVYALQSGHRGWSACAAGVHGVSVAVPCCCHRSISDLALHQASRVILRRRGIPHHTQPQFPARGNRS